jgi:hypothetical protein
MKGHSGILLGAGIVALIWFFWYVNPYNIWGKLTGQS